MLRTHTCGELRAEHVGATVTLAGWVHRRRDHGGLVFVDVRDRNGLTQVVFDPDAAPAAFEAARDVGHEWVVAVDGSVRPRPAGQANPNLPTGAVEVVASALRVLNPRSTASKPSKTAPACATATSTSGGSACSATWCCGMRSPPSSAPT